MMQRDIQILSASYRDAHGHRNTGVLVLSVPEVADVMIQLRDFMDLRQPRSPQ